MEKLFKILMVCTGNVCRSPQAEQILRGAIKGGRASKMWSAVSVTSAGTHAMVDHGMPIEAAELSTALGGLPDRHLARQLTKEMIDDVDLVLALAREHRGAVARLSPKAVRKTFTLREFARTASHARERQLAGESIEVPDRLEDWVEYVYRSRGMIYVDSPDDDNVIDPFRRDRSIYEKSAAQIDTGIREILTAIG